MKYLINNDQMRLYQLLAKKIAEEVSLINRPRITIGLPGGNSILGLFPHLLNNSNLDLDIPWYRFEFFMLDERMVPLDDPLSNFKLLKENFFNILLEQKKIFEHQLHPYDFQKSPHSYQLELEKISPIFDIAILSVGPDGHFASIFPNHPSSIQTNNSDKFIMVKNAPKPPADRMSASLQLIMQTNCAFFLAIGDNRPHPINIASKINISYIVTDKELPI